MSITPWPYHCVGGWPKQYKFKAPHRPIEQIKRHNPEKSIRQHKAPTPSAPPLTSRPRSVAGSDMDEGRPPPGQPLIPDNLIDPNKYKVKAIKGEMVECEDRLVHLGQRHYLVRELNVIDLDKEGLTVDKQELKRVIQESEELRKTYCDCPNFVPEKEEDQKSIYDPGDTDDVLAVPSLVAVPSSDLKTAKSKQNTSSAPSSASQKSERKEKRRRAKTPSRKRMVETLEPLTMKLCKDSQRCQASPPNSAGRKDAKEEPKKVKSKSNRESKKLKEASEESEGSAIDDEPKRWIKSRPEEKKDPQSKPIKEEKPEEPKPKPSGQKRSRPSSIEIDLPARKPAGISQIEVAVPMDPPKQRMTMGEHILKQRALQREAYERQRKAGQLGDVGQHRKKTASQQAQPNVLEDKLTISPILSVREQRESSPTPYNSSEPMDPAKTASAEVLRTAIENLSAEKCLTAVSVSPISGKSMNFDPSPIQSGIVTSQGTSDRFVNPPSPVNGTGELSRTPKSKKSHKIRKADRRGGDPVCSECILSCSCAARAALKKKLLKKVDLAPKFKTELLPDGIILHIKYSVKGPDGQIRDVHSIFDMPGYQLRRIIVDGVEFRRP